MRSSLHYEIAQWFWPEKRKAAAIAGAEARAAAPSRATVWAMFAAAAGTLEAAGSPVGVTFAAERADAMLSAYEDRFGMPGMSQ
jgi:hypothetical protein